MEENILHRKERLIITTIEIMDELGIQKLSTREIARRQGISEATLFRHFKSKNELLSTVLDYYSQFDSDIYQSTKLKVMAANEKITYYINSYAGYYENYPAITSVIQIMDVLKYETELTAKITGIQNNRTHFLIDLTEDAKKTGVIKPDTDSGKLSDIILGIIREISFKWRMNGRNFLLKTQIMSTLEMVLKAFSRD